jgi:hypothetical protein
MITTLGIDPGDTAGFLLAGWRPGQRKAALVRAWQCGRDSATLTLSWILRDYATVLDAAQIEPWDSRPRARGLAGTSPPAIQAQIDAMAALCRDYGVPAVLRQVSDVKRWATDERLQAAGLLEAVSPAPMRHAKSAAWHCLYCAVHRCGLPDPLSRRRETRDVPG